MPILTRKFDQVGRPIIAVYLGVNLAEIDLLHDSGEPIPPPLALLALIDTGASRTVVEVKHLEEAQIVSGGRDRDPQRVQWVLSDLREGVRRGFVLE